jgi:hypothetical protein
MDEYMKCGATHTSLLAVFLDEVLSEGADIRKMIEFVITTHDKTDTITNILYESRNTWDFR